MIMKIFLNFVLKRHSSIGMLSTGSDPEVNRKLTIIIYNSQISSESYLFSRDPFIPDSAAVFRFFELMVTIACVPIPGTKAKTGKIR